VLREKFILILGEFTFLYEAYMNSRKKEDVVGDLSKLLYCGLVSLCWSTNFVSIKAHRIAGHVAHTEKLRNA
jgi:hypothetical protein